MRVAVTGATGNVGVRVAERLLAESDVEEVVAMSSRLPTPEAGSDTEAESDAQADSDGAAADPRVRRVGIDLGREDCLPALTAALAGVDAVIHLAWLLQPARDPDLMARVNIGGTSRVVQAVVDAGVPTLVHASSLGAYSAGPQDRAVDESWPTGGLHTSTYSMHKATAERLLDDVERTRPHLRIVRIRPSLVLQGSAGAEQGRYFLGPLWSKLVPEPGHLPVLPLPNSLRLQVVHTVDLADLYVRAVLDPDARGAYNATTDPVLDPAALAAAIGARHVNIPRSVLRAAATISWRLYLQPTDPGWVDLLLLAPTLDCTRARSELGWSPSRAAASVVHEAFAGVATGAGEPTPPLRPA